jgi:hypothetical protein
MIETISEVVASTSNIDFFNLISIQMLKIKINILEIMDRFLFCFIETLYLMTSSLLL